MGIAVNIEPAAGRKIASAVKIEHKQPTYYNPISTRWQDADEGPLTDPTKYTAAEAAAYNLTLPNALQYGAVKTPAVEAVEAKPAIYSFASFGVDNDDAYGTGTVKVISQDEDATTIEVLTNEPAGNTTPEAAAQFVGKQYVVQATELEVNKHYDLYSDTGMRTPIYVTVELVSEAVEAVEAQDAVLYTNEEVDTYNAGLEGAVKAGDTKPVEQTEEPAVEEPKEP